MPRATAKATAKTTPQWAAIAAMMTGQNVVLGGIAWSVFTLLFFMLFSITPPDGESPFWYLLGTYILETLPYALAAWLCYRNWQSPQIASGREVWLFIGLGMAFYSVANLIYGIWELYFQLEPDVSPADFLYFGFTGLVAWGMVLAVLPRRLNLEPRQWLIIAGIAIVGIVLVWGVYTFASNAEETEAHWPHPQLIPAAHATVGVDTRTFTILAQNPPPAAPNVAPPVAPAPATPPEVEESSSAPGWAISLDSALEPFAGFTSKFYAVADVILLIIASTLLLAFWGGRFSHSWRMIAAATLAQYVADLATTAATSIPGEFESGGLLEVFYVFSGVLYAMGAALEFDVSTSRTSRSRRRRGGV